MFYCIHGTCHRMVRVKLLSIMQISGTMAKFEGLFQDLDVHTEVMDSTMSAATTLNTPEDQVTGLMKQVGERQGGEMLRFITDSDVIIIMGHFQLLGETNYLVFRTGWHSDS